MLGEMTTFSKLVDIPRKVSGRYWDYPVEDQSFILRSVQYPEKDFRGKDYWQLGKGDPCCAYAPGFEEFAVVELVLPGKEFITSAHDDFVMVGPGELAVDYIEVDASLRRRGLGFQLLTEIAELYQPEKMMVQVNNQISAKLFSKFLQTELPANFARLNPHPIGRVGSYPVWMEGVPQIGIAIEL